MIQRTGIKVLKFFINNKKKSKQIGLQLFKDWKKLFP